MYIVASRFLSFHTFKQPQNTMRDIIDAHLVKLAVEALACQTLPIKTNDSTQNIDVASLPKYHLKQIESWQLTFIQEQINNIMDDQALEGVHFLGLNEDWNVVDYVVDHSLYSQKLRRLIIHALMNF